MTDFSTGDCPSSMRHLLHTSVFNNGKLAPQSWQMGIVIQILCRRIKWLENFTHRISISEHPQVASCTVAEDSTLNVWTRMRILWVTWHNWKILLASIAIHLDDAWCRTVVVIVEGQRKMMNFCKKKIEKEINRRHQIQAGLEPSTLQLQWITRYHYTINPFLVLKFKFIIPSNKSRDVSGDRCSCRTSCVKINNNSNN